MYENLGDQQAEDARTNQLNGKHWLQAWNNMDENDQCQKGCSTEQVTVGVSEVIWCYVVLHKHYEDLKQITIYKIRESLLTPPLDIF